MQALLESQKAVGKIPQSAGKNFGRLEKISRHWGIFPTAF
jgi:hypothetical protein